MITRPALRYYGGKWKLTPWIISYFPPHLNYVEPCGGAASVLIQKEPAKLETYNDISKELINFFKVLRDHREKLLRLLRCTPWARGEFEACKEPSDDPIEQARRTFVLSWQSISEHGGAWRSMYNYRRRPRSSTADMIEVSHLNDISDRLREVQLECRDALEVFEKYDNEDTLTFLDPPYLPEVRVNSNYYPDEWERDKHIETAKLARKAKGMVIISGYQSDLYRELYEVHGWERVDKKAVAQRGAKRVESLWLSPKTIKALKLPVQQNLFE
ncbi:DNA adenine methylase [Desulfoluna spongiiphila]|uniref:DNA adenine methylase n=1 Tax=Desulfoluna spongiiphila TaxID=419481 RepID=UPI00125180CE|nr:DNA adenine methylase [Desulfoluna spongiiphila]VVS95342.1 adenine modification methylase m.ecorv-type [Desulfoluna spongiiphila]